MNKKWTVSKRDRKGVWQDLGQIEAASSVKARDIAFNLDTKIGHPGVCDTHRVMPGKTVYEYNNGAICVESMI